MYGVPADLDVQRFHGATLERIDIGLFILHFRFDTEPSSVISVEGDWEVIAPTGELLDKQQEATARKTYQIHVLLGHEVVGSEICAPESFSLLFDSGHRLRIYDHSVQYESFSIQPGDIYI